MTFDDPNRRPEPPGQAARDADPADAPTITWTRPDEAGAGDQPPPASQPVRRPDRTGRLRWGVALLVTALVVGVGAAAAILLTGASAPSSVVGYAAPDSVAYGELRLDLPGDQRQQLGRFLSKFPGFADQSTLDVKIDDVLDRVVRAATDGRQDWSTKIKPWFGGELGVNLGSLPDPQDPDKVRALAILSVTDADRARAWFKEVTADLTRSEATHQGTPLVLVGQSEMRGAMAIHDGRTMLVGDEASVRAALDTGGRSKFATDGGYAAALDAVDGEGLGVFYWDLNAYFAWLQDFASSLPGASAAPIPALPDELMPDWLLMRAQARGDAIAFESVVPHVEELVASTENRAGVLAGHVPPSTFLFLEGHDVGASIKKSIELAKRDPKAAAEITAAEQQLLLIGGVDGLIGWWNDTALAVARDGDEGVVGGLLVRPTDRADADRLLNVLKAGLAMGGASAGIEVREEDHNGTTITIIDLGDAAELGSLFGLPVDPPGAGLPAGRIEIAFASTDDVVAIGSGPAFVRAVLDAGSGDSLADDARYQALLNQAGSENVGSTFVDLAAVRTIIERLAAGEADAMAWYERDVKPYLLPLDAIVVSSRLDGEVDRGVVLITVK